MRTFMLPYCGKIHKIHDSDIFGKIQDTRQKCLFTTIGLEWNNQENH